MTTAAVIIPWRDRGRDPLRPANLSRVIDHWEQIIDHWECCDASLIVSDDGREGEASFCRSEAYNRGAAATDAEVLIFTESDMLVPFSQIYAAVDLAIRRPGLVIPFNLYCHLTPEDSWEVRNYRADPHFYTPEWTMDNGRSIGAINVMSRNTLELTGGYDTQFEGSWYDDNAAKIAFDICAGPTRWIDGPAFHLYHLPGYTGSHLTAEDRAATARNKHRLLQYRRARTADQIRVLVHGG